MREILFLEPVFKEMIWGGKRMEKEFGYAIPGDKTGECWAVSAHSNGDGRIAGGTYGGKYLSWLWEHEHGLFGSAEGSQFPLLVKIIDANDDLSIQVHPDDAYAAEHENGSLGKTECWYILDCEEGADIVIGHNAPNKEALKQMIEKDQWKELLMVRPIKKGDFFQIVPGTVHAIRKGTLILEIQQSSDITYRLYDYGRLKDGKPRELHLDKSIDVITCPHKDAELAREPLPMAGGQMEKLISCRFYTVKHVRVTEKATLSQEEPFTIIDVIGGEGTIDGTCIKKGMHFILPCGYGNYELSGAMELMISHI